MPAAFGTASYLTASRPSSNLSIAPAEAKLPEGALPDGRIATGTGEIARAWLAEPTTRYDHGILGDKIEAGSLVIETRDGKRQAVRLKHRRRIRGSRAAHRRSRPRRPQ